jgi:tetratricopeptide (TPR) repeat protein
MVVTSSPPPEPRVEQLAPPSPPAAAEAEPIAAPKPIAKPIAPKTSTAPKINTETRSNSTIKTSSSKSSAPVAAEAPVKPASPAETALLAKRLDEAKALARAGEITAARTLYDELAEDPRARAKANTALAELEYRQGNYEQAIARANTAMRAGVNVPAFFVRALAELKSDKPADAARDFQKVLDIEPNNSDAQEGLRRAEEQMRRKP